MIVFLLVPLSYAFALLVRFCQDRRTDPPAASFLQRRRAEGVVARVHGVLPSRHPALLHQGLVKTESDFVVTAESSL